ncbi:Fur family transcriptional regulator [Chryseobacterium taichungense]|uniref:Fur family transcriptional regulator, ferric uptake regulator n=1 Tax=Chryseobacterium taichungense TaxID=295069 RepID=A0A1H7XI61_9FLAO|nr:transcriptional repressor [Chryseobacterium taichungense]SEM33363.1 Fur family transcriptional regulator, ferric uptake regulator [Chryseobacterium taichungense]
MKQTRNTQAKTEILNLLSTAGTALSHHEIELKLNGLCNRVTIYRVLERLENEGKIHKIVNVDGVVNYAKCHNCKKENHSHNHLHFNCENCKEVTCIENVVPEISLPENFIAYQYNVVISGICPKCKSILGL